MRGSRFKLVGSVKVYSKVLILVIVVAILLAIAPVTLPAAGIDILYRLFFYATLALVWSYMSAYAGLTFLGVQTIIGVGSYTVVVLTSFHRVPLPLSVVLSGIAGLVTALILSFPLLRMRGFYFAIASLLTGELFRILFLNWRYVGGGFGLRFREAYGVGLSQLYYGALALFVIAAITLYRLYHSKLGLGLRAVGADELAAMSLGVDSIQLKRMILVLSSFFLGIVGALNAIYVGYIQPASSFAVSWSVLPLFMSVLGGAGTIVGCLIGSAVYVILSYTLFAIIGASLLLMGLIALAFLFLMPKGVWGFARERAKIKLPLPL